MMGSVEAAVLDKVSLTGLETACIGQILVP